jgi:hypothetical protein
MPGIRHDLGPHPGHPAAELGHVVVCDEFRVAAAHQHDRRVNR